MTGRELVGVELRVLLGELATVRAVLAELTSEIARFDSGTSTSPAREVLALLAVDLHSYYTALESFIERALGCFEGRLPSSEASHSALLRAALRPIEGIRPAILRGESRGGLDELRRFRHFFRHAYALDLRLDRMRPPLDALASVRVMVDGDLQQFETFIRRLLADVEGRDPPDAG